jgi:hypothetical protein
MNKTFRIRFGFSCSVNRKPVLSHVEGSKTCPELGRTIENLKWLGLLAAGGSAPPHAFVRGCVTSATSPILRPVLVGVKKKTN